MREMIAVMKDSLPETIHQSLDFAKSHSEYGQVVATPSLLAAEDAHRKRRIQQVKKFTNKQGDVTIKTLAGLHLKLKTKKMEFFTCQVWRVRGSAAQLTHAIRGGGSGARATRFTSWT
jgi:hypothetical protein